MAWITARAWSSWAAGGKIVQSCYHSPMYHTNGGGRRTTALLPLHTDTISWWTWPNHFKRRFPGQMNGHEKYLWSDLFVSLLTCSVAWFSKVCLWAGAAMLQKSRQMLLDRTTRSSVRNVGCSSSLQNPSPEYGNWGCSSRKYTHEVSLRLQMRSCDCTPVATKLLCF